MKVGDKIKIIRMDGEPHYSGKEGTIEKIGTDSWGDTYLRGSWGGCSVYPKTDEFIVL